MIESGHRHLLQRRLKIPGARTMENAGNLARARIVRKNVGLDQYREDNAKRRVAVGWSALQHNLLRVARLARAQEQRQAPPAAA